MTSATIYHNSRCSKSREALVILKDNVTTVEVIEYLKSGLEAKQLSEMISLLDVNVSELIRTNEELYKKSKFDLENIEEIIKGLVKNPQILQRPIIIMNGRAIIGRPTEKVEELFR